MATTPQAMNNFAKKYFAACLARDVDYIAAHTVEDEESGFIGFHSGKTIDRHIADTIASIGPAPPASCINSAPRGWMVGDVAWLIDFPTAILPNGQKLPDPVRVTFVMRKVRGEWKMAHWHLSESLSRDLHAK